MFGSQALETAIGLVVMFFVIATASSAIVEAISRIMGKRAKDFEVAIGAMLAGNATASDTDIATALGGFKKTSIYQSALRASGKSLFKREFKKPAYLSAKGFVDALTEFMTEPTGGKSFQSLPKGLQMRLKPILLSTQGEALQARAGLEQWFDETMGRLEGSYKRWASLWIFLIGLVIVVSTNASTFKVADRLYRDPATRQAVADAATSYSQQQADLGNRIRNVADATDTLKELKLPIGWDAQTKSDLELWQGKDHQGKELSFGRRLALFLALIAGWIATALLVMLGAPFWFDVLTKLASLRSSGAKPPEAKDDPTSSMNLAIRERVPGGGPGPELSFLIPEDSGEQRRPTARVTEMDPLLKRMLGWPQTG